MRSDFRFDEDKIDNYFEKEKVSGERMEEIIDDVPINNYYDSLINYFPEKDYDKIEKKEDTFSNEWVEDSFKTIPKSNSEENNKNNIDNEINDNNLQQDDSENNPFTVSKNNFQKLKSKSSELESASISEKNLTKNVKRFSNIKNIGVDKRRSINL
jgi:hypothetical protein